MKIDYTQSALAELDEIHRYNERTYGIAHALDYIGFLQDGIDRLADDPEAGKAVEGFPNRRALTLRRNKRGAGHTAIYRIDADTKSIIVLHVFHTAQNMTGRMEREP